MSRQFLPYEINHLKKYGLDISDISPNDETPVEYLTNYAQFRDIEFFVNKSVLIPRIETEQIIDEVLKEIKTFDSKKEIIIADICTGSGCIGLTLAKELINRNIHNFHIYLSDISSDALLVAQKNLEIILPNHLSLVTIIQSDLLKNFPKIKIDILVSNPPYIPSQRVKTLDNSVKLHEPLIALDGGENGTKIINQLLQELPNYISEKFVGFIEIDEEQSIDDFTKNEGLSPSLIQDCFNKNRFLKLSSL